MLAVFTTAELGGFGPISAVATILAMLSAATSAAIASIGLEQ